MLRSMLWTFVLLAVGAGRAPAQQAERRTGLWLGLGLGPAWSEATCSVCLPQESGPSLHVRMGGSMSSRLLAGAEATGWIKESNQVERWFYMVTALATLYPSPELGLHLKAGLGGYAYTQEDAASRLTTQGLALELGAGYDVPITAGLSLSPFATWARSGFGNPKRLDKTTGIKLPLISDMKVEFFQVGLGVTIH